MKKNRPSIRILCGSFLLTLSVPAFGQFSNLRHADASPGSAQGTKITATQNSCSSDTAPNCGMVLSPTLNAWRAGTLSARASNALGPDYRESGALWATSLSASTTAGVYVVGSADYPLTEAGMQKALDAAAAAGGGDILVTGIVPITTGLTLAGAKAVNIECIGTAGNQSWDYVAGFEIKAEVVGLTIGTAAVDSQNGPAIRNCMFHSTPGGTGAGGVLVLRTYDVVFEHDAFLNFSGAGHYGVKIDGRGGAAQDPVFINSRFFDCHTGLWTIFAGNVLSHGNRFDMTLPNETAMFISGMVGGGQGALIQGDYCTILNESSNSICFKTDQGSSVISGKFESHNATGTVGVQFLSGANRNVVAGHFMGFAIAIDVQAGASLNVINGATFVSNTNTTKVNDVPGDTTWLTWEGLKLRGTPFSLLGTPPNGTMRYCSDCTISDPCFPAGTGALAKRLNDRWVCN